MIDGISVIVCCYNSAWILAETLYSLINQKVLFELNYEIIIINNNSTDNTLTIAYEIRDNNPHRQIKIYNENRQGLMFARERGILESAYSYLLFCDDDNLLCENYVSSIYSKMRSDLRIGACAGYGVPNFLNTTKPVWFEEFKQYYATGYQDATKNFLYGAGCCFRKSSLELLRLNSFTPLLTGRKGNLLLAGDDSELIYSLIILGYKICALNDIYFEHVLQQKRLTPEYLLNMTKGFGLSFLPLQIYRDIIANKKFSLIRIIYLFVVLAVRGGKYYIISLFDSSLIKKFNYTLHFSMLRSFFAFNLKELHLQYKKLALLKNN